MNTQLQNIFLESIQSGLSRKIITTCSKWSEKYRVLTNPPFPGPWTFKRHPWLRDMQDSQAELNVGKKAAQMGFTECVLNVAFYNIDILRRDVLYILPSKTPDAGDFSSARFDAALEASPRLENLFSDTKNVGHKRAGSCNFYLRGSKSRAGLKSIPVSVIIMDEVEEFNQKAIPLAFERSSGQLTKNAWLISTPSLDHRGIDKYYQESSKNCFFIKCPSCSRYIDLSYPESIEFNVEDATQSRLLCKLCKNTLKHEEKIFWLENGKWVPEYTNKAVKGWSISQLYSTLISPEELTQYYIRSTQDFSDEQEFYNSKLGQCHEVSGARVTDKQLNEAKGNYKNRFLESGIKTLGIDVGHPYIHFQINKWLFTRQSSTDINVHAKAKVLYFGKLRQFEELDELMHEFEINFAVIDAHPERRKALEFASRFWGLVRLCFYVTGIQGKALHISDDIEPKVSCDRTSFLDLTLGRFRSGTVQVPYDIDEEYKNQIKAPVRIYLKDKDGNPNATYSSGLDQDHYAHAANYAEIALPFAVSIGRSQSISGSIL